MPIRLTFVMLLLSSSSSALADDAKQIFDSLYGQRIKAVKATADRADDHALARELLAAAGSSTDTPALLALMCEASYDLGSRHPDGFTTAAQAMTLLAESVEAQRTAAREKLVDVLMKQSRQGKPDKREAAGEELIDTLLSMGDEKMEAKKWTEAAGDYRRAQMIAAPKKSPMLETIKARLELASRRDRAEKQIARLSEKLLADANDSATAEEIVKLYVVEFDDAKSALPFLNRVKDEQLKKLVPLAAKALGDVAEDDCLELGEWFKSLANTRIASIDAALLRRAAASLDRYIASTSADALRRRKATLLRTVVGSSLEALGESGAVAIALAPSKPAPVPVPDPAPVPRPAPVPVPQANPNDPSAWRIAGELLGGKTTPQAQADIKLPDELQVTIGTKQFQISGEGKHATGTFLGVRCGHFGKAVLVPGKSLAGTMTCAVSADERHTGYQAFLTSKSEVAALDKFIPLKAGETYTWKLGRNGDDIRLVIADQKNEVLSDIAIPADQFVSLGFAATVRYRTFKADLTVTWK